MSVFTLSAPIRLPAQGVVGLNASPSLGFAATPTLATLSGSSTTQVDVATSYTVTLNVAAEQSYTVTWLQTGSATIVPTTSVIAAGQLSATASYTWPSGSSGTVDFTISPSLTRAGRPKAVTLINLVGDGDLPTNTLTAGTTASVGVSYGQAFKDGALAPGDGLAGKQVNALTHWPSGYVRFAIVSSVVSGATSYTDALSIGSAAAGAALTTADLKAELTQAVGVDAGAYGAATWSGTDWDSPWLTHATGPLMSSWIYRRPIGSDAHLVAWLEVRLWSNGDVEVLPWIENGYLAVAGPTSKSATYSFTMGGTTRFSASIDLPHHCRTPLVGGAALSHWLGSDPGVVVKHDTSYLMATDMVPTYAVTVDPAASVVTSLPSTYTPLQQGGYPTTMGDAGAHSSIGPLPIWDVLYLTCSSSSVWSALQRNAYSAGRYALHYRDEATNLPPLLVDHPAINYYNDGPDGSGHYAYKTCASSGTLTPTPSGTVPKQWAFTHQPAVGYMAALVTGRHYHIETVQFAALSGVYWLQSASWARNGSDGRIVTTDASHRGVAWCMRDLINAANVSPSGDVRDECVRIVQNNVDWYHGRYVAQSNCPQGFTEPYSDIEPGESGLQTQSWQNHFFNWAWAWAKATQPAIGSTAEADLDALYAWNVQSIIGLCGGTAADEYLWRDAGMSEISVAPGATTDWATGSGPWHADWGAVWAATQAFLSTGTKAWGDGTWRMDTYPSSAASASSWWANFMPALAYAVRHDVTNAWAAWERVTSSPSWYDFLDNCSAEPQWAIMPPVDVPAYVPAPGAVASLTVANGKLANSYNSQCANYFDPYYFNTTNATYGGAFKNPYWGRYGATLFGSGGHGNHSDNSLTVAEYGPSQVTFKRVMDPTPWFGTSPISGKTLADLRIANSASERYDNSYDGTYQIDKTDEMLGGAGPYEFEYGLSTIDGKLCASHTYGGGVHIGPLDGGGACGTHFRPYNAALNRFSVQGVVSAMAVDFDSTTASPSSTAWYKHSNERHNEGRTSILGDPAWPGSSPILTAFVPAQKRIYMQTRGGDYGVRWYDWAAGAYVTGTGAGFDFWLGDIQAGTYVTEHGSLVYVPQRNLLLCIYRYGGNARIQYMDVSVDQPTLGGTATLSASVPVGYRWGAATWVPESRRVVLYGTDAGASYLYEVQIPSTLSSTWTVTQRTMSGTMPDLTSHPAAAPGPWQFHYGKRTEYDRRLRAIFYYENRNNNTDVAYVIRPEGT